MIWSTFWKNKIFFTTVQVATRILLLISTMIYVHCQIATHSFFLFKTCNSKGFLTLLIIFSHHVQYFQIHIHPAQQIRNILLLFLQSKIIILPECHKEALLLFIIWNLVSKIKKSSHFMEIHFENEACMTAWWKAVKKIPIVMVLRLKV